jgi:hypothetical protein
MILAALIAGLLSGVLVPLVVLLGFIWMIRRMLR